MIAWIYFLMGLGIGGLMGQEIYEWRKGRI